MDDKLWPQDDYYGPYRLDPILAAHVRAQDRALFEAISAAIEGRLSSNTGATPAVEVRAPGVAPCCLLSIECGMLCKDVTNAGWGCNGH